MNGAVVLGLFTTLNTLNQLNSMQGNINLIILGFKVVILLFIIQFFRNRFGNSPLVTLLVAGVAYIFLFTNYFKIFGTMMFIYFFIILGFTSILMDLALAKPWRDPHSMERKGKEEEGKEAYDEARKQEQKLNQVRTRY